MLLLPAVTTGQPLVNTIHHCDVMTLLRALPDNCINCVVTSPPYWQLRDYQTSGQIGLEPTLKEYIDNLTVLFREVRRVLRDDGTCWVNMGDSFASSWASGRRSVIGQGSRDNRVMRIGDGLKEKDLCGVPWRLAFALQDDGWYLRSDIIWEKPTCMPESVTDRPTRSHEYVFLLTKNEHYFYDGEAIREPAKETSLQRLERGVSDNHKNISVPGKQINSIHKPREHGDSYNGRLTRNKRSVWRVNPEPFSDAHFATFPTKLIEPMILAGCPAQVCSVCGAPYERQGHKEFMPQQDVSLERAAHRGKMADENHWKGFPRGTTQFVTEGFKPTCDHNAPSRSGLVLDPFMGSGTTALVARKLGRNYLGCDLNADYVAMAKDRLRLPFEDLAVKRETRLDDLPLFAAR